MIAKHSRAEALAPAAPAAHPAVRAWVAIAPDLGSVNRVETIKPPKQPFKSAVFRLVGAGHDGADVIAKECRLRDAQVERTVYRDVLKHISVDGPRFLGSAPATDPARQWLFMQHVNGPTFEHRIANHARLATGWLAALHAESADGTLDHGLPIRRHDFYRNTLIRTTQGLRESDANPSLSSSDRSLLKLVEEHLLILGNTWDHVADLYSSLPTMVVHGDFKRNNMAFLRRNGRLELRVFDWAEAHIGPPAVDVRGLEPAEYRRALLARGWSTDTTWIERAQRLGVALRMIMSVSWELPALQYEWVERAVQRLVIYERRLASVTGKTDWMR